MENLKQDISKAILKIRKRIQNDQETSDDVELLELYCLLDIPGAMPDYGVCLIKQNKMEEAFKWFKRAEEKGNGYVNFLLSGIYASLGDDFIEESMNCLRISAKRGFELAKGMLEEMERNPFIPSGYAEA